MAKNNAEKRFFNFLNFFAIFFWILLPESSINGIREWNFFSLFLGLCHPSLYRNCVRMMFSNFLNILAVFFGNGRPTRVGTEFGTKIFFSLSRPLSTLLDRNNAGKRFLIFFLFFSEFSCSGRVWMKFGTKIFFSLFLGLSHPVSAKNNVRKRFLNFFEFFCYFSRNFLARVVYERNSRQIFFFPLSWPISSRFG